MIRKFCKICTFTISPFIAGWFLADIMSANSIISSWLDWTVFLVASVVSIYGYIASIRNYHSNFRRKIHDETHVLAQLKRRKTDIED